MNEKDFDEKQVREFASRQTREVIEKTKQLAYWLDGFHHPSEGENFEYIIRSYLRKRIPKRFEVSTGFVSTVIQKYDTNKQLKLIRKTSSQFDIIIWDSLNYPTLVQADDFVVLPPEAVISIIEITKSLDQQKLKEDLEKFDSLYSLYSYERQEFKPYTAILALSSRIKSNTILQGIEKYYLYDSVAPPNIRYSILRSGEMETRYICIPGFLDSICVLDKGIIQSRVKHSPENNYKLYVRYCELLSTQEGEESLGFFEQSLVLFLSEKIAQTNNDLHASIDLYREFFSMSRQPIVNSILIEDFQSFSPSLNISDRIKPITFEFPSGINNASRFEGISCVVDNFIESIDKNWKFLKYSENLIIVGKFVKNKKNKMRVYFLNSEKDSIGLWLYIDDAKKILACKKEQKEKDKDIYKKEFDSLDELPKFLDEISNDLEWI